MKKKIYKYFGFFPQISIQKDEICTIRDNSNKLKWKVTNGRGQQGEAPGMMFLLTPPDQVMPLKFWL